MVSCLWLLPIPGCSSCPRVCGVRGGRKRTEATGDGVTTGQGHQGRPGGQAHHTLGHVAADGGNIIMKLLLLSSPSLTQFSKLGDEFMSELLCPIFTLVIFKLTAAKPCIIHGHLIMDRVDHRVCEGLILCLPLSLVPWFLSRIKLRALCSQLSEVCPLLHYLAWAANHMVVFWALSEEFGDCGKRRERSCQAQVQIQLSFDSLVVCWQLSSEGSCQLQQQSLLDIDIPTNF